MPEMVWRIAPSFPDYEVSECGDVRRATASRTRTVGQRLKGFIDSDGYLRYSLKGVDGRKRPVIAHRLVAETFIGPAPTPTHEVAHSNGSRVSCYWRDLRWATRRENDADRLGHGTAPRGENNGRAKITEDDVRFIRAEYRAIKLSRGARSVKELEDRFGLHRGTICGIANGKHWPHVPTEIAA